GRGDGQRRPLPRVGRVELHDRPVPPDRRRHHRRLHHPRVADPQRPRSAPVPGPIEGPPTATTTGDRTVDRVTVSLDQLKSMIAEGTIETVLVAFPDNQGRLVGKRVMADFFLSTVAQGSIEACNYLLAVDVEMNPLPGYKAFNWDK